MDDCWFGLGDRGRYSTIVTNPNPHSSADFKSQPWLRKLLQLVLLPFVLPAVLLVLPLLLAIGAYAGIANLVGELRLLYGMWRANRYVSPRAIRKLIRKYGGTLVIESPSPGWNYTHAWWTPDDLLSLASSPPSTDDDYKAAIQNGFGSPAWDCWCWENYTSPETGSARLLRVWNGKAIEPKLRHRFPTLSIVHCWTALVYFPSSPQSVA